MIFRRGRPVVLAGAASTPADEQTARGDAAFEARQFLEAWHAYRTAFRLDPSPIRASRAAVAAPYTARMSAAIDDLWQWLVLKRDDARRCGDDEESWSALEALVDAYEANARRSEQTQATQRVELDRLEQEVAALKETVKRLESEPRRFLKPTPRDRKP